MWDNVFGWVGNNLLGWLRGTAVLLLCVMLTGILFIGTGVFDAQPVGVLQAVYRPFGQIDVGQSRRVVWLDAPLPHEDFSVRVTAVYQSGESDSLCGLAIGNDEGYLFVGVSPSGYVTVEQSTSPQSSVLSPQPLVPFQTWPHVHAGTEPNEIWIDVIGDEVTVRINRELLWAGEVAGAGGQVGVVVESFGETAVFDFPMLQLFWEAHHEVQ